jgi:hypothetical protein
MGRVNILRKWANTGSIVIPSNSKIEEGWLAEIPAREFQNWWQNQTDQALEEIEQLGVQTWSAFTAYRQNALALGSNGTQYKAVQATTGDDPTADDGTNWIPILGLSGEFTSSALSIASNSSHAVAHGLGAIPRMVRVEMVCKIAESGYGVGDVYFAEHLQRNDAAPGVTNEGLSVIADATNVSLKIGVDGIGVFVDRNTGSSDNEPTVANWDLFVRAWG